MSTIYINQHKLLKHTKPGHTTSTPIHTVHINPSYNRDKRTNTADQLNPNVQLTFNEEVATCRQINMSLEKIGAGNHNI